MYKLVIFDLDGTLLNTIEDICDSLNLALSLEGLATVSLEECKYMVGSGVDVLIERAVSEESKRASVKKNYLYYYAQWQRNKTSVYPDIMEVVEELKKANIKTAVFSNKPHEDTLAVISHYFGEDLFDYVLGHKAHNKPKPAIDGAREIMEFFKLKAEDVLYIGDTSIDMQTAKAAKFTSVAVTWGFRKASEIIPHNYIIDEAQAILAIVRGNL